MLTSYGRPCGGNGGARADSIASLKASLDLVELAGKYVALKRSGRVLWGCCPFHSDKTPSLQIDPERQNWRCWSCGKRGDAIDFLIAKEGVELRDLLARSEGRQEPRQSAPADPEVLEHRAARKAALEARGAAKAAHRQALALDIWRESEIVPPGLPTDYLVTRRKIASWDPDRVRWHPACPWGEGRTGCLIVPVQDHGTGYVTAIWRIRPVMEGDVERRGLGPITGNASQLFHAEPDDGPLAIAEGVEDALAVHQMFGLPTWAALSRNNMASLILPPRYRRLLTFPDHDADGGGVAAARSLARRLKDEGREVEVLPPTQGKDPNEVLSARENAR